MCVTCKHNSLVIEYYELRCDVNYLGAYVPIPGVDEVTTNTGILLGSGSVACVGSRSGGFVLVLSVGELCCFSTTGYSSLYYGLVLLVIARLVLLVSVGRLYWLARI